MTEKYTFSFEESPDPNDLQIIRDGLTAYNLQFVPDAQYKPLNIFLRAADGRVLGGLVGNTYWDWLYISLFWLDESVRRGGYGREMLARAEKEALRRGCHHAHLDTLDFQAPAFYEKQGYSLWGTLNDLPVGHKRIFFWKELSASNG
jgi:GNAT superfamily N-acetyltransferase